MSVRDLMAAVAVFCIGYFFAISGCYLAFTVVAWRELTAHRRRRRYAAAEDAFASPLTPGVSVIVPAFNEQAGIVESVRSLLALRYPRHEVIVVNDGSHDATLSVLREAFDLVPIRMAFRHGLPTEPIRGAYVSRDNRDLWVLDKHNGGKADAINAGVNAARHPYICVVDADALLDPDALLRVAQPLVEDPDRVIATGGIVRIANGCEVDHGRVVDVRLPRSRVVAMQALEYFRAFLVGRVGWTRMNALLIISGAFGLFDRRLVEAVGGWSRDTVGEDVELVVRLHRYLRERDEDYRILFVPDPVCWTEAPESLRMLQHQRRRWHRGLGETLWRHRRVLGNPRYGTLGLVAFPYFVFFELLGPVIQVLGLPVAIGWWLLGGLSTTFLLAYLSVALLVGILLSLSALALEELNYSRHPRARDVARLACYSLIDNLGYRQLNDFWRILALGDVLRGHRAWGEQRRRGFSTAQNPIDR
jgi:cellulose synthase/poly-beta-1,6-N-acetylglucosamine synthase-like glycosyltransferase